MNDSTFITGLGNDSILEIKCSENYTLFLSKIGNIFLMVKIVDSI